VERGWLVGSNPDMTGCGEWAATQPCAQIWLCLDTVEKTNTAAKRAIPRLQFFIFIIAPSDWPRWKLLAAPYQRVYIGVLDPQSDTFANLSVEALEHIPSYTRNHS